MSKCPHLGSTTAQLHGKVGTCDHTPSNEPSFRASPSRLLVQKAANIARMLLKQSKKNWLKLTNNKRNQKHGNAHILPHKGPKTKNIWQNNQNNFYILLLYNFYIILL